jgi:hypothetical protein
MATNSQLPHAARRQEGLTTGHARPGLRLPREAGLWAHASRCLSQDECGTRCRDRWRGNPPGQALRSESLPELARGGAHHLYHSHSGDREPEIKRSTRCVPESGTKVDQADRDRAGDAGDHSPGDHPPCARDGHVRDATGSASGESSPVRFVPEHSRRLAGPDDSVPMKRTSRGFVGPAFCSGFRGTSP